jgi:HAD superfamily hydrolase (TIGR01549 family)
MILKSFRAVIFDMDGVIVDSEPRHERAFEEIWAEIGFGDNHGIHFPDYYGTSDEKVWRDFIARNRPSQSFEELFEWRQNRFLEIVKADEPIFGPIPDLVSDLASQLPLALASGSLHPVIEAVLGMKGLRDHFRAVVSSSDVAEGKPAPDIFLRAAEEIEVAPGDCVVIEDSVHGVSAAKSAGMQAIAITNTFPASALNHADHVVSDYDTIRQLLLG